ncbi:hypothetical protein F0U60_28535 [Archangium minus]|uniref:DUF7151 domain-containing protein n=1 Tax=Archangium minus TaxID=83450 RepID=A0ABY9WWX9_9BACT|nr:hypothetical protein F0U60_28535 [Archangium minus]
MLMRVEEEPAGASCGFGGKAIHRGVDRNGDGQLLDAEVESTEYVCRDTPAPAPSVLVRRENVAPGTPCKAGGVRVEAGADTNGNGELEAGEVRSTEYVCQNEPEPAPSVLVTQTPDAPGPACAAGGFFVRAGADTNRNGTLDDAEVQRSFHSCQSEPVAVLLRTKAEPVGTNCADGGVAVQAGPDTNEDGALGDGEVETTSYVCGEAPESVLVKTVTFSSNAQCEEGGTHVLAGADVNRDGVLDDAEVTTRKTVCAEKQPGWTYYGDYKILTAADVVALQGASRIRGSLQIVGAEVEQIDLPDLWFVDGAVSIHDNPKLTQFWARIQSIRNIFLVHQNPVLTSVSIFGGGVLGGDVILSHNPLLGHVRLGRDPTRISGNVSVEDNAALGSLSGLEYVSRIDGTVSVTRNASLTSGWGSLIDSWPRGPRFIGGRLTVSQNPKLSEFVTHLEGAGDGIYVMDNPSLYRFEVERVEFLPGSLVLQRNPVLSYLLGFELLRVVGGDLTLEGLAALEALRLDALLQVGGSFSFVDNDKVWSFFFLDNLLSIGGDLRLTDNAVLVDAGFLRLRAVGGGVYVARNAAMILLLGQEGLTELHALDIRDNPQLRSLRNLMRLSRVEYLEVSRNPMLSSLELPALKYVSSLTITDNTGLSTCLAKGLLGQLSPVPGSVTISGNGVSPECP